MRVTSAQNKRLGNNQLFPKTCLHCGAPYFTSHPQQTKWCGDSCRSLSYQKRKLQQQVILDQLDTNENNYEQTENQETEDMDTFQKILDLTTQLSETRNDLKQRDIELKKHQDQDQKVRSLEQSLTETRQKLSKAEADLREYRTIEGNYFKLDSENSILAERLLSSEETNENLRKQLVSANVALVVLQHVAEQRTKIPYSALEAVLKESGLLKKSENDDVSVGSFQVTRPANGEFFTITKRKK